MTIKIQCDCGTKFAFDTPESGAFPPGSITCPNCGVDATETANGVVAASAAPVPVPEKKPGLTLSLPASHAAPEPSAVAPVAPTPLPPKRSQEILKQVADESRLLNRILLGGGLAIALLIAAWAVYTFKISRPKVVYAFDVKEDETVATRLLSETELLVARPGSVQLVDVNTGAALWSHELPEEKRAETSAGSWSSMFSDSGVQLHLVGDNIAVLHGGRVTTLNRKDGSKLAEAAVPPGSELSIQGDSLLAVSGMDEFRRQLVRVSLADGVTSTQVFALPQAPKVRRANAAPLPAPPTFVQFANAGASILTLDARLLEQRKTERREARVDNSGVPGGTLTAGQDIQSAAKEIFKGVGPQFDDSEDASLFRVTLRGSAEGAAVWTNDVSGPPCLFPLAGLDALVAGQTLWAFEKSGAVKWQAKLSNRIVPPNYQTDRFGSGEDSLRSDLSRTQFFVAREADTEWDDVPAAPAFTDLGGEIVGVDRGSVALYDAATGEVRWRYGVVGTRRLLRADDGSFYICGMTMDPYAKHGSLTRVPEPLLIKIDGKTGAEKWIAKGDGSDAAVSGKYVYVASTGASMFAALDAATKGEELQVASAFARVDPKNGRHLWMLTRKGAVQRFEARNRTLLVHLPDRVEVLRYWAF
jgi:outer membrane protein assembly factor BamB